MSPVMMLVSRAWASVIGTYTACRSLGGAPQYWSLRESTSFTPGSQVSSLKGPVPTGCLTTSLPHFLSDSGL